MAEMVESAGSLVEESQAPDDAIVFGGQRRNMAMGIAMFGAGAAAFVSGLTHTFFAEAIAWTFILWGIFFLYTDLLLTTRKLEVRSDSLTVDVPFRPWSRKRVWKWEAINRVDVIVHRRDIRQDTATLQVYHQYPGEISLDREDVNYDPELARLIVERARLKPDKSSVAVDMANLPLGSDTTFTWKK
jgi:hypothetical protein